MFIGFHKAGRLAGSFSSGALLNLSPELPSTLNRFEPLIKGLGFRV